MLSTVVMDTNVIVNLIIVSMLDHVGGMGARFVITDAVFNELSKPRTQRAANEALKAGFLERLDPVTDIAQLRQAAEY